VWEKNPLVLCIQESKLQVVNDMLIKSVWGDIPCGYSFQKSEGASGSLISVWDASRVNVWASMGFGNVLVVKGTLFKLLKILLSLMFMHPVI
jgi:hypothetical protein